MPKIRLKQLANFQRGIFETIGRSGITYILDLFLLFTSGNNC